MALSVSEQVQNRVVCGNMYLSNKSLPLSGTLNIRELLLSGQGRKHGFSAFHLSIDTSTIPKKYTN
jgi:hypothetical protein